MSIEMTDDIIYSVKDVDWKWSRSDIEQQIANLGWRFVERFLHRDEYRVRNDVQASIYFGSSD